MSKKDDSLLFGLLPSFIGLVLLVGIFFSYVKRWISTSEALTSGSFIILLTIIIVLSLSIPDNVEHSIEYLIGGIVLLVLLYSIIWTRSKQGFKSTLKMLIIPGLTSGLLYLMLRDRTDKLIVNHIKDNKKYYIALAIIIGLSIIMPFIFFKIKSRRNNYIYI